ncbi:STN domain-containing protein [Bordetella genomosp. 13]|uniref:Secretin/TonB short N-terminal domain-containing protein n=1 Tax=Bordetella genomosp. 13 TaxID=463040 RepID=A0A1W6ZDJ2_9BORD|nr:STN domain-containing protein [Bordetella genomosp. 13]ARP95377.1 hypothetical protein CAL15_13865 [Bordetella genomosp. 13]
MARYRATRVLARLTVAGAAVAMPAVSKAQPAIPQPAPIEFNIPSLALHEALQRYSRATGLSLLYDGELVRGKMSPALHGRHTAPRALARLIEGTGMTARYTSHDALVLVPDDRAAPTPGALPAPGPETLRRRYYAHVQRQVLQALCRDPATRPGGYRTALRFRIDDAHAVAQLEVHAQDRPELEQQIRQRLSGLSLDAPPPAGVAQPLTLVVLPAPRGGSGSCDAY